MARFVKVGKVGSMINVEQITAIYPNEESDKYAVCMTSGSEHYVTHDELLEITGQWQHQASNKKYAIKVFKGDYQAYSFGKYLAFNRETGAPVVTTNDDDSGWQAHFTEKEIEELKKCDDIAIDWDKVELEEVNGNE